MSIDSCNVSVSLWWILCQINIESATQIKFSLKVVRVKHEHGRMEVEQDPCSIKEKHHVGGLNIDSLDIPSTLSLANINYSNQSRFSLSTLKSTQRIKRKTDHSYSIPEFSSDMSYFAPPPYIVSSGPTIAERNVDQPFRFLHLPPNLRLIVYENLDVETTRHVLDVYPGHRDKTISLVSNTLPVAILSTCKLLNAEATPTLEPKLAALCDTYRYHLVLELGASLCLKFDNASRIRSMAEQIISKHTAAEVSFPIAYERGLGSIPVDQKQPGFDDID